MCARDNIGPAAAAAYCWISAFPSMLLYLRYKLAANSSFHEHSGKDSEAASKKKVSKKNDCEPVYSDIQTAVMFQILRVRNITNTKLLLLTVQMYMDVSLDKDSF